MAVSTAAVPNYSRSIMCRRSNSPDTPWSTNSNCAVRPATGNDNHTTERDGLPQPAPSSIRHSVTSPEADLCRPSSRPVAYGCLMPRLVAPVITAGTLGSTPQPVIEVDDELVLRPFRLEDAQAGWAEERSANWAVAQRSSERMLGRICLYPDLGQGMAEIGYWILPAARRKDVASRAVTALTTWAHDQGMYRISLEHSVLNEASCRVAQRCGFVPEGVMRGAHLLADGRHDVHLHAHLASDEPSGCGGE